MEEGVGINASEVSAVDGQCGRDLDVAILSIVENVDERLIREILELH